MTEREIAVFTLTDIFAEGGYNNIMLRKTLKEHTELNGAQRAFVTELVNGSLRSLRQLDYIIGQYSKTPVKRLKPFILNNLRIGAYQLLYMDKIPDSAACNEAVKLAKKRHFGTLAGFVNGVLRSIARNKENISYPARGSAEYLAIRYSFSDDIINYWLQSRSYSEVEELCMASLQPPRLSVCVNTLKTNKRELAKVLEAEGMEVDCDTLLPNSLYISKTKDIGSSRAFKAGLFHIMDESSMLAAYLLGARKGQRVLDACAAPGGKSFAIAEGMENSGEVISADCYEHKIKLIADGAQRLGIDIIKPTLRDALCPPKGEDKLDCILIDAPCSGLGLVKKKPDIRYNKTPEDIEKLAELQMNIVRKNIELLKPNGTLVYSTCTISDKENIENVKKIRSELGLEAVPLDLPMGIECATAADGYIELKMSDYNTDGFFIAKFRRK